MPGHIIERTTARNRLAELGHLRCFQCHGTISGPTYYDVVFRVASGRIAIIVSQVPRVGRLANIFSQLLQLVMLPGITRDAHNCEKGRIGVRNVGHRLAEENKWFEAGTAAFVVTGQPPSVPLIRETIVRCPDRPEPGEDRITLEIDPRVSPQAVTQRYTALRRDQMWRGRSSARTVDAKYAAILEFWQDYGGCNQHERVRRWNAAYPEWSINMTQPNALRQLYVRAYRCFYGQRPFTPHSSATP